jgi:putative transposase
MRNQRRDALHKATTELARTKPIIVMEDLHVAGWPATVVSPAASLIKVGRSSKASLPTRPLGTAASSFIGAPRFYPPFQ